MDRKASPATERDRLAARIDYSNIPLYEVRDADVELMALKAVRYSVGAVVVSPSSLAIADRWLAGSAVKIAVSVSYPSGAYLAEAKQGEIEELLSLGHRIDELYMVMAVGTFLSGHYEQTRKELVMFASAAAGRTTKVVTELAHLSREQRKLLARMAADAGINAIVTSTSFVQYDITLPTAQDVRELVEAAAGEVAVVAAGGINTWSKAREFLDAGADRIFAVELEGVLAGVEVAQQL
jgi:deoxyribose-phosphate aldolase